MNIGPPEYTRLCIFTRPTGRPKGPPKPKKIREIRAIRGYHSEFPRNFSQKRAKLHPKRTLSAPKRTFLPLKKIPIIGLTGLPASGKTTVAWQFQRLNCAVLNADQINHEILTQPSVIQEVTNLWGPKVLDRNRQLDREAIAQIVFYNPDELKKLTALLHPRITAQLAAELKTASAQVQYAAIVMDVPLLFELDLDKWCDCTILVEADDLTRYQRLKQRHGWDQQRAKQVEKFQQPIADKRLKADYIIRNEGLPTNLQPLIQAILNEVLANAEQTDPNVT